MASFELLKGRTQWTLYFRNGPQCSHPVLRELLKISRKSIDLSSRSEAERSAFNLPTYALSNKKIDVSLKKNKACFVDT